MMKLLSTTIFFLLITISLSACKPPTTNERPIPPHIKQIMNQSRYTTAKWGFYVKDLTTNQVIYRLNANKMFIPASASKLFGTAALLHTYGFDYTFQTPIYALGKLDNKGVLNGDLVLVGKGDPNLGGRLTADQKIAYTNFDHTYANVGCYKAELTPQDPLTGIKALAKQIKSSGISTINGNILVDNRLFETSTTPRTGNILLSPIMINDNLIDIEVMPTQTGKTANIQWRPQVSQVQVVNQVITGKPGEKTTLSVKTNGCSDQIIVSGTIGENSPKELKISAIQDPQKFAKNALVDALHAEGISISTPENAIERLPDAKTYQSLKPIATWISPPILEEAKLILKVSHNPGANLIPYWLAIHEGKTTLEDGMHLLGNFVRNTAHVNPNEISFRDTAGDDSNYFTCDAAIKMLEYVYHLPPAQFEKSVYALPSLGEDGSLSDVAHKTTARGHVFAKEGTGITPNLLNDNYFLTGEALAGYVKAKNGHWLAFMVVVNSVGLKNICGNLPQIREDIGMIAAKLYEEN